MTGGLLCVCAEPFAFAWLSFLKRELTGQDRGLERKKTRGVFSILREKNQPPTTGDYDWCKKLFFFYCFHVPKSCAAAAAAAAAVENDYI
jgi:hypothetical protein